MKKFYKVEAFRPGEESALKYTFHVYSENEPSAKNTARVTTAGKQKERE